MQILIAVVIGIFLLVTGFVLGSFISTKRAKNKIDKVVEDTLVSTLAELAAASKNMKNEFEEKYQALLMVYEAMENSQQGIRNSNSASVLDEQAVLNSWAPAPARPTAPVFNHPKYPEIKEMLAQGQSIADIARSLDMGKGEVQLIIGLNSR